MEKRIVCMLKKVNLRLFYNLYFPKAQNETIDCDDTSLSMSELMTNYQKPSKPQPSRIRFAE